MTNGNTNGNGNGNTNGLTSKEFLTQIWNKMESIESKLDTKLGELDRRVIILELETVKRDGPVNETLKEVIDRLNTIESASDAQMYTDDVLHSQREDLFNKRNILLSMFATLALISNVCLAVVTLLISN